MFLFSKTNYLLLTGLLFSLNIEDAFVWPVRLFVPVGFPRFFLDLFRPEHQWENIDFLPGIKPIIG